MLGYKLQLLKAEFEQTERKLSTWIVIGTTLKKLEHVCNEIKHLEAEFRCGRYHPDLLENRSSLIAKNFGSSLWIRLRWTNAGSDEGRAAQSPQLHSLCGDPFLVQRI